MLGGAPKTFNKKRKKQRKRIKGPTTEDHQGKTWPAVGRTSEKKKKVEGLGGCGPNPGKGKSRKTKTKTKTAPHSPKRGVSSLSF